MAPEDPENAHHQEPPGESGSGQPSPGAGDDEFPEIEKEPIDDPETLKALLGEDYQGDPDQSAARDAEASSEDEATAQPPEQADPSPADMDSPLSGADEDRPLSDVDQELTPSEVSDTLDKDTSDEPPADESDETVDSGETAEPEPTPEPADTGNLDDQLRQELEAMTEGDSQSLLSEGKEEDVLDDRHMEEPLRGDSEAAPPAAEEESPEEAIEKLTEAVSEDVPEEEPVPPSEAETGEVASENVAAAAAEEEGGDEDEGLSQDFLDNLLKEAQEEPESSETRAETVPEDESAEAPVEEPPEQQTASADEPIESDESAVTAGSAQKARIQFGIPRPVRQVGRWVRQDPVRLAASLAAGLVVGLLTFQFLSSNRLREVPDLQELTAEQSTDIDRAMAYAKEQIRSREYQGAVETLDQAIQQAPPSVKRSDAQFLRLEALYRSLPQGLNDAQAAPFHREADRLLELAKAHPRAPEAMFWKADVYERQDNPLAAKTTYREILLNYGESPILDDTLIALAELNLEENQPSTAGDYARRLLQEYPGSPLASRARLLVADALAALGQTDDARALYIDTAQAADNPRASAMAYEKLGELAMETGDYEAAIRELETRLEEATTIEGNDKVYLLLGKAYRAADRLEDARQVLNELIDFFPESEVTPEAFNELSQVLMDLGVDDRAVRLANQAAHRFPSDPAVLRNQGNLLAQTGEPAAAAHAYAAAHAAGSEDPTVLLAAGRNYRKAGLYDEATQVLDELTTMYPTAPAALDGSIEWSKAAFEAGQVSRALERLENLAATVEGRPQQVPVLAALGELYRELGLEQSVKDVFGELAAMTNDPELAAQSAIALLQANAVDEGLAVAKRINLPKLKNESAYDLLMEQGKALLRIDPRQAVEKMEQAYESYPAERTAAGDQMLLEANLKLGRAARARAIVAELDSLARQQPVERPRLEKAAVTWGDFLFERGDYSAAARAYSMALDDTAEDAAMSEEQQWAAFQRANALMEQSEFTDSIALYERVAAANTPWSKEAQALADAAKFELRLRGVQPSTD